MHLPLARLVSMLVIFCLHPSSSIVILVFYLFSTGISEQHEWELWVCKCKYTVHWFDASCSLIPLNNSMDNSYFISPVQSLAGLHFCRWQYICVDLQISEQFSPKARTPAHWMMSSVEILTQNDDSGSFKVIRFGVNEEPLRGYIVQYKIVALNMKVAKI